MKKYSIIKDNAEIARPPASIEEIVDWIRMGVIENYDFKPLIQEVRDGVSTAKRTLPGFTPSGEFWPRRETSKLKEYSGTISVDVDDLASRQIDDIRAKLPSAIHVLVAFISAGGKGIRMLVMTDAEPKDHDMAFELVSEYVLDTFGVKNDPKIKPIAQQCYFSYDPQVYYNPDAATLEIGKPITKQELSEVRGSYSARGQFEEIKQRLVEAGHTFKEGQRNDFIFKLACACREAGIPQLQCQLDIIRDFQFSEQRDNKEILRAVQSAYRREYPSGLESNDLEQFSTTMYDSLPPFLRDLTSHFEEGNQRDVFLLGALTVMSGCFPMIYGDYDKKVVYPNLYSFIIAPAASGKGVVGYSTNLAALLNDQILKKSLAVRQDCIDGDGDGPCPEIGMLMIPANNSSAGIIQNLKNNMGWGIIAESEADTIGNNLKREWGNFSPVLRKAYHHETITYARKTQDLILIDQPKLSISLTSTPGQLSNIMQSTEDGLFSRFLFYSFDPPLEWRSGRPTRDNSAMELQATLNQAGHQIQNLHNASVDREIEFTLSDAQWDKIDSRLAEVLHRLKISGNLAFASSVKRMGLIVYRLAMNLSISRNINGINGVQLSCIDTDLDIAISIGMTLLKHAGKIMKGMQSRSYRSQDDAILILDLLPEQFSYSAFINAAESLGFPGRTAARRLKSLQPRQIVKKGGQYHKVGTVAVGINGTTEPTAVISAL